jgi:Ser/Thr protein kinase RdoA (MazF antagonist)
VNQSYLQAIAQSFIPVTGAIADIQPFGSGNINHTFLVSWQKNLDSKGLDHFILQRINTNVFPQPVAVMQNLSLYLHHVGDRLAQHPPERRWDLPQILSTNSGEYYLLSENGEYWRSLSLIADSQSIQAISNLHEALELGYALATFHYLTMDLDPHKLLDSLPNFHITPIYLQAYEQILNHGIKASCDPSFEKEVNYCQQIISDRRELAFILENAKNQGKLPMRVIHGDPKVNNILFDQQTNLAVSMIDLDTVKAGLWHYDIGDCLRSGCNRLGEETQQWQDVSFDLELCQAILKGYFAKMRSALTKTDCDYIYDAVRVITFELGLRFFSDYLAGDIYFQAQYSEHNLQRSLVQFQLLLSIESQADSIKKIIADLSNSNLL